jgi:hypothetical protein
MDRSKRQLVAVILGKHSSAVYERISPVVVRILAGSILFFIDIIVVVAISNFAPWRTNAEEECVRIISHFRTTTTYYFCIFIFL